MYELVFIGILSGIAVSLVKLVQAGFYLSSPAVEFQGALLTYLAYMVLGAIGAVFLVDHDARGQKMLKSAFLMGFVAPSFFLALVNHPITSRNDLQEILGRIPKLSELLIGVAHAEDIQPASTSANEPIPGMKMLGGVVVLDKSAVEPSLGAAVKSALGAHVASKSYTYVVGMTDSEKKALATASQINRVLTSQGSKVNAWANVIQP